MKRPLLVEKAIACANAVGFENSCMDEVGEFLHLLAGHVHGRIAEIGTGCGVGTAWLASATSQDVYTVDHSEARSRAIRDLFSESPNVHTIVGDWRQVLQEGPFALIFVDAKPAKLEGMDQVIRAAEVGGLIFLDDLTPEEFWPEEWRGKQDPIREAWLHHPQLVSV